MILQPKCRWWSDGPIDGSDDGPVDWSILSLVVQIWKELDVTANITK